LGLSFGERSMGEDVKIAVVLTTMSASACGSFAGHKGSKICRALGHGL